MATINRFEDLDIWQKARAFCLQIDAITRKEPFCRDFPLKGQIDNASGSIMDNIAEGFERSGNKEFIQFLFIAKGSCGESRSQLYRALDKKHISEEVFNRLRDESLILSQSIFNFIQYLKNIEHKGYKYK